MALAAVKVPEKKYMYIYTHTHRHIYVCFLTLTESSVGGDAEFGDALAYQCIFEVR